MGSRVLGLQWMTGGQGPCWGLDNFVSIKEARWSEGATDASDGCGWSVLVVTPVAVALGFALLGGCNRSPPNPKP